MEGTRRTKRDIWSFGEMHGQAGRNERVVVGKLSSLPPFLVSLSIVAAGEGGGRDRAAFIWGRLEANGGRGGGTDWKE